MPGKAKKSSISSKAKKKTVTARKAAKPRRKETVVPSKTAVKKKKKSGSAESGKKQCSACGITKAKTEFSKDRTKKDGRYHLCKVCRSTYRAGKKNAPKPKRNNLSMVKPNTTDTDHSLISAVAPLEAEWASCAICGEHLLGYVPGYIQGQPACKECVIGNIRATFSSNRRR